MPTHVLQLLVSRTRNNVLPSLSPPPPTHTRIQFGTKFISLGRFQHRLCVWLQLVVALLRADVILSRRHQIAKIYYMSNLYAKTNIYILCQRTFPQLCNTDMNSLPTCSTQLNGACLVRSTATNTNEPMNSGLQRSQGRTRFPHLQSSEQSPSSAFFPTQELVS